MTPRPGEVGAPPEDASAVSSPRARRASRRARLAARQRAAQLAGATAGLSPRAGHRDQNSPVTAPGPPPPPGNPEGSSSPPTSVPPPAPMPPGQGTAAGVLPPPPAAGSDPAVQAPVAPPPPLGPGPAGGAVPPPPSTRRRRGTSGGVVTPAPPPPPSPPPGDGLRGEPGVTPRAGRPRPSWRSLTPTPFSSRGRAQQPAPEQPAHLAPEPASPDGSGWRDRVGVPDTAQGRHRQRQLVLAGLVALVVLGTSLAVVGWKQVRGTTPGRYVDPAAQPDEPGFVALVTPTPTLLVVHEGGDGALAGVTLLALRSQDDGGSVIVMPAATRASADDDRTLAGAYAEGGVEAVGEAVEQVLNVAVHTLVELDDAAWSAMVAPVGPLTVEVDGPVAYWPAGDVTLASDEVGGFLGARNADESELSRLSRQERFWQSWLDAVANGGDDAVPGEDDVGLGRFVRGLAGGPVTVSSLPVAQDPQVSEEEAFLPDQPLVAALVAGEVPYPQEPSPGSRIRVRLLNGTADRDLPLVVTSPLVQGGAEIAMSGNARSFAERRTRLIYSRDELRDEATTLREALGFGVVEASEVEGEEAMPPGQESERVDVTVILGADALDAIRRSESTD